ncbi:MAG TPA: Gfo/Idh/MocA family oxidoreductase [archaeon]|nr:Gfo/Idh/MocA family oxidoreductase [archaeon]
MDTRALHSEKEKDNPGRRDFLQTVGKVSLGLAASGIPVLGAACKKGASGGGALLDPKAPLRIGMIGREGHLYVVFGALDKIPGARITAYAFEDGEWEYNSDGTRRGSGYDMEPNRKWVEGQAWAGSNPKLYETYQEMLDKEKLDLVVVCLPYARNAYAAAQAAGAGAHILCEKPVAVNFQDLEMLQQAVDKNGVRLSAMFTMRYSPAIFTVKRTVEAGLVGKVCMARGQKSYKFGEERPWFYKVREIYGSSILWVAIHAIDYIRWSTGLEVRRVSAFHGNLAHPDYPGCQDHGVVIMDLEGGPTAAVTLDYLRPEKAPSHGDDRLRVIGSSGVVEKREIAERVELITREEGPKDLEIVEPPDLFPDFVGELRGLNKHLIGPDEAVRVTRICIAATQAAEEGRVIEV